MKMKNIIISALVALFIVSIGVPVMAREKHRGPIFMG